MSDNSEGLFEFKHIGSDFCHCVVSKTTKGDANLFICSFDTDTRTSNEEVTSQRYMSALNDFVIFIDKCCVFTMLLLKKLNNYRVII